MLKPNDKEREYMRMKVINSWKERSILAMGLTES